jgi:aspartate-semialdehyde dehydrogenase
MADRLKVGVLAGTGMVGQKYIQLLEGHPWFDVSYICASPRSAGKKYSEAVSGRWHMQSDIPEGVKDLVVENIEQVEKAKQCDFMFSALDSGIAKEWEHQYAGAGIPVVSNASAHRHTDDVPMIIPEINADHADIIPIQQKNRGWDKGFIVVKPNCSVQSYMAPLHALMQEGYNVEEMVVSTLQAVSGAGHPGVSSWDAMDNIIPYIGGEEKKSELEPLKIWGRIEEEKFKYAEKPLVSAHCNRVPVLDGHTACVSAKFDKKPDKDEILKVWKAFSAEPQKLKLPSAPEQPIIYRDEDDRPQPRLDRDVDKGMAVTCGRLRECNVFDWRFVGLSHNTVRGAAGGGILNAELLKAKGYL